MYIYIYIYINMPIAWFPDAQLQLLPCQLSPGGAGDPLDGLDGSCGSGSGSTSWEPLGMAS